MKHKFILINKTAKMSLLILLFLFAETIFSCKKYLSEKSDTSLTVSSNVKDAQALIDNETKMNTNSTSYGETSADDYYLSDVQYNNILFSQVFKLYIWDKDVFNGLLAGGADTWNTEYDKIYRANLALETLAKIERTSANATEYDNAKGGALFYRAVSFWALVSTFSKAYNLHSANSDLGIPLKITTDENEKVSRNNTQTTYNQIIDDLISAIDILPNTSQTPERASKASAYGMLARVYLSMGNYVAARQNAELSLNDYNFLLDYNMLTALPTQNSNHEILFYNESDAQNAIREGSYYVDSTLYNSYSENDLRKKLFFKPNGSQGYYLNIGYGRNKGRRFCGIAEDEIYLIKAECEARANDLSTAIETLNLLLKKRYDSTFIPFHPNNIEDALKLILIERRKELILRNLRWSDIKRLNLENAEIVLRRNINGKQYKLLPNANHYALPIPPWEVNGLNLGQNPY